MLRIVKRSVTVGVLLAASACSLLVDTSELDAQCGPGMKICEGKCVSVDEPFYGCGSGCAPCTGDHIVHGCENGACTFVECQHGWGCENCATNLLTSDDRCGSCNISCVDGQTCSNGICVGPPGAGGAGGEGGNAP